MAGSHFALLIGFGLLPATLWAQKGAYKPLVVKEQKPVAVALADSAAHYQRAVYPGGEAQALQVVQRNVRYPAAALRAGVEGRVVVALVVEADGSVGRAHIVKSPSPLLSDEVLQAVKSLGAFTPARQYDKPVRSTVMLPISFHIMGGSKGRIPAQPSRATPQGPVQPQVSALTGHRVVRKLASWQDSTYWVDKSQPRVSVHHHYFTNDRLGRPATHTQEYWKDGLRLSWQVLRYEYNPQGRLAAKISNYSKHVFQYNPGGELSSVTGYNRVREQWVAYEETLFKEKAQQPDGSRVITQEVSYTGVSGTMQREIAVEYLLTADSLVKQSTTYFQNHQTLPRPQVAVFTYDTNATPFGELIAERWHRFEAGLGSPHNEVSALSYGKAWRTVAYTYDAAGYPTRAVTRRGDQTPYQTQVFAYADVLVPAPLATEEKDGVVIYPNPAAPSALVSIKAATIGKGPATLRLFDAATGELRRQTEHVVATTFDVTLAVTGLAKGSYLAEITSGRTVAKGRLLVE